MPYQFKEITIRTNNSNEEIKKVLDIWLDITSGKLPLLFDSDRNYLEGISPISRYSNYETDETGNYDLSIMAVTSDFFQKLELLVSEGRYKKYDVSDDKGDIGVCAEKAWKQVWDEQKQNKIKRLFTEDYESVVPVTFTKDGKAHCYLYIAVEG